MAGRRDGDGKVAEGKFTEHLNELMKNPLWWYHRYPDAGVCMGRVPKQPADYEIMYNGSAMMLVECKESKSETSIPASRFTQTPKMTRFSMAGGYCGFLIYFRYAANPYWIFVPLEEAQKIEKSLKVTPDFVRYCCIEDLVEDIRKEMLT